MPPPNPIRAIGTVLSRKGPRLYVASLPNGKTVLAHVPAHRAAGFPDLAPDTRVHLELTAFDFSTARIAGVAEPEAPAGAESGCGPAAGC